MGFIDLAPVSDENGLRDLTFRFTSADEALASGDYHCTHSVVIKASCWADDVRLSDLELRSPRRRRETAV